jgi:hypothetical protein
MNTYTKPMHPEKEVHRTGRNNLFPNITIMTVILTLVTAAAIAIYIANRPVAAAENSLAVPYSNALEMQYARPWLEAQNKLVVPFGNALEMQYARPWLEVQNKSIVEYSNALELQYPRPWLEVQNKPIVVTGNAQEQILPTCHSSLEMLYARKYGDGRP